MSYHAHRPHGANPAFCTICGRKEHDRAHTKPGTLVGAVIRDKASGTTWRVVQGERMRYVAEAIAHGISRGNDWAYRNLSNNFARDLRTVGHVERLK